MDSADSLDLSRPQQWERLQQRERFLTSAFDALSAHIAILHTSGTIVATNNAWRRFAEAHQGDEERCGVGSNYLNMCDAATDEETSEAQAVAAGIRQVLARRREEFQRTYACHGPTEERWFTIRVTRFEHGGTVWAVVAHEDVTALRKKEQTLRQREEWFRALSTASPLGIFQTDAAGHYVYTNPRWQEIFGLSLAESLGHGWMNAIHSKDRPTVRAEWVAAVQGKQEFSREFRLLTSHGKVRWVQMHVKPMPSAGGCIVGAVGTVEEVSTKKEAEAALRKSEERWQLALTGTNDGLWDWNIKTNNLFLSARYQEILGFLHQNISTRFEAWVERIHPDDGKRVTQALGEHFSRKTSLYAVEFRMRCRDESYKWVLMRGRALREDGYAVRMVGSMTDISARKQAEEQRADFLAMLTHDIKNPLTVVLGYVDLLLDGQESLLTGEGAELLGRVKSNALTVHSLVTNYLDLSKIEAGHWDIPTQPVRVDQILHKIGQQYEAEAHVRRLHFSVEQPEHLPLVNGNVLALERVFANLLYNALKFTPEGGKVILRSVRVRDGVKIEVVDTGPGMTREEIPLLFERYHRAKKDAYREGSGLGLFIVKALVDALEGRIEVTSTPGEGSCFAVFLPVAQE
jgi:PAS domain S-box-containing protein